MNKKILFAALLPFVVAGCENSPTDTNEQPRVALKFSTSQPSMYRAQASGTQAAGLTVQGTNGVLNITDVRFIVSEFELERLESECDNSGSGNLCDDFEAPPTFVRLPLDGSSVTFATDEVPEGSYDELDFEVENVEVDEDDDSSKRQQIQQLFTTIRSSFSDFPNKASMVIVGSFTPTGSTESVPFQVYADAELEVELEFPAPLVISRDPATPSVAAVTIDVMPSLWFKKSDGSVYDLSAFDFKRTGRLLEFEFESEVKEGFSKVKIDD